MITPLKHHEILSTIVTLVRKSALLKTFATLVLFAEVVGAEPIIDIGVPGLTGDMPYYFSGTNCRARGEIAIVLRDPFEPPIGIWKSQLFVGGELVAEHIFTDRHPDGDALGVIFDSSHFPNGSTVQVEFRSWDTLGRQYSAQGSTVVKNGGTLFGRYDIEVSQLTHYNGNYIFGSESWKCLPYAGEALVNSHYGINEYETSIGWTGTALLASLAPSNVFVASSHGQQGSFWDDQNDYWLSYPNPPSLPGRHVAGVVPPTPFSVIILPQRVIDIGTGLPPYNSTMIPPFNFILIQACSSGVDNSFAEAFLYPYGNIYTGILPIPEDQCVMGTGDLPDLNQDPPVPYGFVTNQTASCNEAIWKHLQNGYTAYEAREQAYLEYDAFNKPDSAQDLYRVWGDFFTRLKGVYTGTSVDSPMSNWYRAGY